MEWSPLRFRPGAEQSNKSDRHPEYGAQAYQQEMALTSIERHAWQTVGCSCQVVDAKPGSKCRGTDCVVFCRDSGNDGSSSDGSGQTHDVVGTGVSHPGIATWPVEHHGAV